MHLKAIPIFVFAIGAWVFHAKAQVQTQLSTGIWRQAGTDGCGDSSMIIKKIKGERALVEIDQTSACFAEGRSNSATFRGEALRDSGPTQKLVIDLKTNRVSVETIGSARGKSCEISLSPKGTSLRLDFKNCEYAESGGQTIAGSTLKLARLSQRPSFKCEGRITLIESLICAESDLADRDREVSRRFKNSKKQDGVQKAQTEWIKSRDECTDASTDILSCLKKSYDQRLSELQK